MRKLFLTYSIVFASLGFLFSQSFVGPPCAINSARDTINFLYPASDSFPCIDSGIAFYDAIQISLPNTMAGVVVLDSMVITSITGLPAGIAYSVNPPSGVIYGDSNGCVAFAGTATGATGHYPITFSGYAVVTTQSAGTQTYSLSQLASIQGAPVPSYVLNIIGPNDTCNPQTYTAVQALNQNIHFSIYPNPNNGVFDLELLDLRSDNATIQILDLAGRAVYVRQLDNAAVGKMTFDLSSVSKGLYILQLKTSDWIATQKISIQ
jgi:hypothetical protein